MRGAQRCAMTELEPSLRRVESVLVDHPELHDVFETWAMACIDEWMKFGSQGPTQLAPMREKLHLELARVTWGGGDLLAKARRVWLEYVLDTLEETTGPQRNAA